MAKRKAEYISYQEQDKLMKRFCHTLVELRTEDAFFRFLKDLLNRQERLMLIRRLQIASMLEAGQSYAEIIKKLHCGPPTIARVARWLRFSRDGLKDAIKKS